MEIKEIYDLYRMSNILNKQVYSVWQRLATLQPKN